MKFILVAILAGSLLACQRSTSASKAEHHYPMTGKVVSIDSQHQTATINAAAIPNYMEAMTMEYPVQSKVELDALHPGEQISATVDVTADASYSLSNVKPRNAAK